MLNHTVTGPHEDGSYLVVYPTPGCDVPTPVCACRTVIQAEEEAARLNSHQVRREIAMRDERQLRGLGGVHPELDNG